MIGIPSLIALPSCSLCVVRSVLFTCLPGSLDVIEAIVWETKLLCLFLNLKFVGVQSVLKV